MPLTAYRDPRPGMGTPERGCYPDEPDPRPGDEDYLCPDLRDSPWWMPRLLPARLFGKATDVPMAPEAEGRRSKTVTRRIASSCAGWAPPHPSADEFYDAVRAEKPSDRQSALLGMWMNEASEDDLYGAWYEGAYTWTILAAACRRTGRRRAPIYRVLNTQSKWTADMPMEETWSDEGGVVLRQPGGPRSREPVAKPAAFGATQAPPRPPSNRQSPA